MEGKIQSVKGRMIIDSRANPTVEAEITFSDGSKGIASVPSGASTGKHEAEELRDETEDFNGKGVDKAINNINETISTSICGHSFNQQSLDNHLIRLDGTNNKSHLGANAILAVSLAFARANANSHRIPLYRYLAQIAEIGIRYIPCPEMNVINGGAHADNSLDMQEFIILPIGFNSFERSMKAGVEIYNNLKRLFKEKGMTTGLGDEGGFAPEINNTKIALNYLVDAIKKAGYKANEEIYIGIDVAATQFYKNSLYHLPNEKKRLSTDGMIGYMKALAKDYPIAMIEDALSEDDWDGWHKLTESVKDIELVGDDLFVTNIERLKKGIEGNVANAILIKLNQIGTLSETIDVVNKAQDNHYQTIISHRSGDTEDNFISHLSIATNSLAIKSGAPARSERVSKYNELLRIIEKEPQLKFSGRSRWKITKK